MIQIVGPESFFMASLNSALLIIGMILFGVVTTAACLKLVIWFLNLFAFGSDVGLRVASPSFMRCAKINILVFGIITAVVYAGQYGLVAVYGKEAFRYTAALEWFETLLGMILMAVVLAKLLPTSAGRATMIAFVDWIVLFFVAAGLLGLTVVLAYSTYTPNK